jgi:hypothetical protein
MLALWLNVVSIFMQVKLTEGKDLSTVDAECHNMECSYDECFYSGVIVLTLVILTVIMLSVNMLGVSECCYAWGH